MKSLAHIIIATMLLITLPSMLYAETAAAQVTAIEQSDDLFADIGGTQLTDAQADMVEGDGWGIVARQVVVEVAKAQAVTIVIDTAVKIYKKAKSFFKKK